MSKFVGVAVAAVMVLAVAIGIGGAGASEAAYSETWGRPTASGGGQFTPPSRLPSTTINGQSFNVIRVR